MSAPSFVDTNVLVYAEDRDAGRKHEIARELVVTLWNDRSGVLSVQVLQELYVTLIRKVRRPLAPARAAEIVREYLTWRVVDNDGDLLVAAMGLQQRATLSFWDALVVEAASAAGCERLYSEDLNPRQRFGAVEVVNPFAG
jgi:predicted nucleic acid-binding protein